jgi:signal transduction histidine kinase
MGVRGKINWSNAVGSPRENTLSLSFSTSRGSLARSQPFMNVKMITSVLVGLKEAVVVVLENGDLILNPAAKRLLGVTVSLNGSEEIPAWLHDSLPLEMARTGARVEECQLTVTPPGERRKLRYAFSIRPLKDGKTGPILGGILTLRDLTEQANELEQLALAASHDLSGPLRTVSTYLRLLEKNLDGHLSAESRQMMHFAQEGTQNMRELLDGLLRKYA